MLLPPYPDHRWDLARQMGVTHIVTRLPRGEDGDRPWDFMPLLHLQRRFADAGLTLAVVEETPPLNRARLGIDGAGEEIAACCDYVRNAGAAEIPVVCWNWMAQFNWLRTSTAMPARGGALVTAYDHTAMRDAPLTEAGIVEESHLWDTLAAFLEQVVPVAERAGVKLALHPDDPPVSPLRGIARILRDPDAMQRALDLAPSPNHGLAFCQGTFAEMGCDIPPTIRRFAPGRMHFVHFRDIRGSATCFQETFHDDGQTDMAEAIRTYQEIGFSGVMRPDHVPTMAGEANDEPGYETLGRLFAIGYMRGLIEGVGRRQF